MRSTRTRWPRSADAAAKAGMKPGTVADPGAAADDVNLDDEED